MAGLITLIGSGETAAGMAAVHRELLGRLTSPPKPVFLETPAGFELGLQAISDRFVDYFRKRFDLPLAIAPYRRADDDSEDIGRALSAIADANYILAGPGSPTYAVRQWRNSTVFAAVIERWRAGAQLVLASSAAIAIGRHCLPVYEIYKVGLEPFWEEGLDLLGPSGFELAIVSHWDNAEGGTHDTRACFMGRERFAKLKEMLPPTAVVLGIDEHTACTLDFDGQVGEVRGRGRAVVLRGAEELSFESGRTFPLRALAPAPAAAEAPGDRRVRAAQHHLPDRRATAAEVSQLIGQGDLAAALRLASRLAPPELAALLRQAAQTIDAGGQSDDRLEALIHILVEVRGQLRTAEQWEIADRLRDGLAKLGIELQDTPEGTLWQEGRDR